MHPIAGQGLNAGLKDVAALAEVLADARRRGEDIGRPEVLERYQRWRRFDTATLLLATDVFNRLFSNDNPFLRLARSRHGGGERDAGTAAALHPGGGGAYGRPAAATEGSAGLKDRLRGTRPGRQSSLRASSGPA
jgi:hypothetical protein